jgi:aristolochene synthase
LIRFTYDLHLSSIELNSVADVERNCGKHISLVNDIHSHDKEKSFSRNGTSAGAVMCNAVQILADQIGIPVEAAKKVLWVMVREYEHAHRGLVHAKNSVLPGLVLKDDLVRYVNGLEHQMNGNELWNTTTASYRQATVGSIPEKRPAPHEHADEEHRIRKRTGDVSQAQKGRRDTLMQE